MTVQTIVIDELDNVAKPIVRLAGSPPGSVWQYTGFSIPFSEEQSSEAYSRDLNCASQIAAKQLAEKVAGRKVKVELVIDPMIPPLGVTAKRLMPIITAIAENASASVEPGPGTVVLRTWCNDTYAGIDAVGCYGNLPEVIRGNLMLPGFSTRVAEWDTGFGLHMARESAAEIAGKVELFDPQDGVGFRFVIPVKKGTPLDSPETMIGIVEEEALDKFAIEQSNSWPFRLLEESMEVPSDVKYEECIDA